VVFNWQDSKEAIMNKFVSIVPLFLLFWALGCVEHDLEESFDFPQAVTALDADIDSANLLVEPASGSTSSVDMDIDYRGREPKWHVKVSRKTLSIRLDCHFSCDGDFVVRVPREVISRIELDSGNTTVRGLDGDVAINADSGNIKVSDLLGDLDLEVDSGNISGNVSSQVCVADLDSGNFNVHFYEPPADLDVAADSGNIKVRVPRGAYNITTDVDSGSRELSSVTQDDSAPNRIHAEVDSGNVTITGY
jgi:hypothetical protein